MSSAGYGYAYDEWAWQSPEEPVTPDMVEEEGLLIERYNKWRCFIFRS